MYCDDQKNWNKKKKKKHKQKKNEIVLFGFLPRVIIIVFHG